MDEANINEKKTEHEAIGPADWDPNVCNSLERMLPEDINKDRKENNISFVRAICRCHCYWRQWLRMDRYTEEQHRYRKCKPYSSAGEEDVIASEGESQRIAKEHDAEESDLTIKQPMGFAYYSCPEEGWLDTILC